MHSAHLTLNDIGIPVPVSDILVQLLFGRLAWEVTPPIRRSLRCYLSSRVLE